jgi:hypothetical protein
MKKYCFGLAMLLTTSVSAQRYCDMQVSGGITSTTITIDPSGATPTYYEILFTNNGLDTLKETDTIFFSSIYLTGGSAGYISPVLLDPGGSISINDTSYFKTGPVDGPYKFCDSVWVTSIASDVAMDTVLPNNYNCQTVPVVTKTTSVADVFTDASKEKTGSLTITPNPAGQLINVDFVARNKTEVVAEIYDLSGRMIISHRYGYPYTGQSGYSLDITSLQPGLYFITMKQEGVNMSGKLFKQ